MLWKLYKLKTIMSEKSNTSNGIGFAGILSIVFLVLKLTEVIDWSWWWITAPLWIGLAIMLVVLAVIGFIYIIAMITKPNKEKEEREPIKKESGFQSKLEQMANNRGCVKEQPKYDK